MANAAKKKNLEEQAKREQQRMQEREKWQQEFIARQSYMQKQMEHRKEMRKLPKSAWIFMAVWGSVLFASLVLFIMSFNSSTSGIVNKVISVFKVF